MVSDNEPQNKYLEQLGDIETDRPETAQLLASIQEADKIRRMGALVSFVAGVTFGLVGAFLAHSLFGQMADIAQMQSSAGMTQTSSVAANVSHHTPRLAPWLLGSRAISVAVVIGFGLTLIRLAERLARPLGMRDPPPKTPDTLIPAVAEIRAVLKDLGSAVKDLRKP